MVGELGVRSERKVGRVEICVHGAVLVVWHGVVVAETSSRSLTEAPLNVPAYL